MFSWVLASDMFLEVVEDLEEACGGLYGILFDFTWTTVDSKDGAVGVGGYGGTCVTGEWSGAGRINGESGRSGGVNGEGGGSGADGVSGETGISGADGENGERGESCECSHVVDGIV